MTLKEEYDARKAANEAKYKNKFLERWFSWWRNPPDRFAGLVAFFTALLFAATVLLYLATRDLVLDAQSSGRAWVGPIDANITPLSLNKPLRAAVIYGNTGRQPAITNSGLGVKIYSSEEWTNGKAVEDIMKFKDSCMSVKAVARGGHMVYPTTGFTSFTIGYDANLNDIKEGEKIVATDKLISGDDIVAFRGCFAYLSIEIVRHTAFCFYFRGNFTDPSHLNFCAVGQEAD
jgi:hypothetical protein